MIIVRGKCQQRHATIPLFLPLYYAKTIGDSINGRKKVQTKREPEHHIQNSLASGKSHDLW